MRIGTSAVLAAAVAGALAIGGASAQATVITWDLSSGTNPLGHSNAYTADGYTITATGWTVLSPDGSVSGFPYGGNSVNSANLYAKSAGTGEQGLGIASDPQNEIKKPTVVQLDVSKPVDAGLTSYEFQMGSTTNGEAWSVFGSSCSIETSSCTGTVVANGSDMSTHPLSGYDYYWFTYTGPQQNVGGANVLLGKTFTGTTVPVPASWMLMGLSLAGLGFMGYRRSTRGAVAA